MSLTAHRDALQPPDSHYVTFAEGWIGLGLNSEARKELSRISPELHQHPRVLEVWFGIHSADQNWQDAVNVAGMLKTIAPDEVSGWLHYAYALRRAPGGTIPRAWEALAPAAKRFPKEPVIPYNLACYACQSDRLDEAREYLQRAILLAGKDAIHKMALADEDLQPLWPEISGEPPEADDDASD